MSPISKTQPNDQKPIWHFPPTGGGEQYVQDQGFGHFRDNVFEKFVREILQNSTDARDPNFDTVFVELRETEHSTQDINADALIPHIEASITSLRDEDKLSLINQYQAAVAALRQPTIRCLDVSDANTIGLQEPQWQALIYKVGSNQKGDSFSAGGTHGIGKFAAFNISLPSTVFYYTCHQRGHGRSVQRIEQWTGKSILTTHHVDAEELQHIGFYRYDNRDPITSRNIPADFRFNNKSEQADIPPPNTTISIIGFQPHVLNWTKAAQLATVINFFAAIKKRLLVVTVTDINGASFTIDSRSIAKHFDDLMTESPKSRSLRNAYDHYSTLSSNADTKTFHVPAPIDSPVDVIVRVNAGASRCAYINANGMLITDAKSKQNPFHISIPPYYPPLDLVIQPTTPGAQTTISKMENVSHDEIQVASITDPKSRAATRQAFAGTRQQISDWIAGTILHQQEAASVNLSELAHILADDPELNGSATVDIQISLTQTNYTSDQLPDVSQDASPDQDGLPKPKPPGTPGPPPNPKPDETTGLPPTPSQDTNPPSISNIRFIASSSHTAAVLLTTDKPNQSITITLAKRGEILYVAEPTISILSAHETSGAHVIYDADSLTLTTTEAKRYTVRVTTAEPIDSQAISVRCTT